jgi:mannosyltransferase
LQQIPHHIKQHYHWVIGASLFFIALAFDFHRIAQPSIWFDEAFSIELARQPLPRLWSLIFGPEPNMELYYLFLHLWLNITSSIGLRATEIVVRSPSAVFSALSTIVVFAIARRFLGTFTAILGSTLYLLSNETLVYAQQARSYALQVLFITIAWHALLMALTSDNQQRRCWIIYVIASALSVYAQLFSFFVLLSQGFAILGILSFPNIWRGQAWRQWKAMLVSGGALFVLLVPMLIIARQGSKTGWIPIPRLYDVYQVFRFFAGYQDQYLSIVFAFCGISLIVVYFVYIMHTVPFLRGAKDEIVYLSFAPIIWSLICWIWVPLGVSYVVSHGSTRIFSSRYLVVIVPPFFLLAAFGVASLKLRVARVYFAALLLWMSWPGMHYYYESAQVEDWKTPVQWLVQHYRSGDGLICYDNVQGCQIGVEYYLQVNGSNAAFSNDSPGAFSWVKDGPVNTKTGYQGATSVNAIAAYAKKYKRIFYIVARLSSGNAANNVNDAKKWMDSHYRFTSQIVGPTVLIRMYEV